MVDYLIGTGGWAYFRVPGLPSLVAYSRIFDFVEVNSTFYQIPNLKAVELWRRRVPENFEFSVRCNRVVTHKYQFQPRDEMYDSFDNMIAICKILRAAILHLLTPPTFEPNKDNAELLRTFASSVNSKGVKMALEVDATNQALSPDFVKMMQDHNMIHCIDLSKDEKPAYESDILYSRLFGKGPHNIYQPTDEELRKIDRKASKGNFKTVAVSFHYIRMYKDAARFKIYKDTGKFPMVTKSTGVSSLKKVLMEDAKFPSSKKELISHQGWKIIDLTKDKRVHASYMLRKLPEKTYNNVSEVVQALSSIKTR